MALSAYRPSLHAREQINDSCALNKAFCEVGFFFFLSFSFSRTNFFVLFFPGFLEGGQLSLCSVYSVEKRHEDHWKLTLSSQLLSGEDPLFRLPEWREIRKRVTRDFCPCSFVTRLHRTLSVLTDTLTARKCNFDGRIQATPATCIGERMPVEC